jgi:hypothetical protein
MHLFLFAALQVLARTRKRDSKGDEIKITLQSASIESNFAQSTWSLYRQEPEWKRLNNSLSLEELTMVFQECKLPNNSERPAILVITNG